MNLNLILGMTRFYKHNLQGSLHSNRESVGELNRQGYGMGRWWGFPSLSQIRGNMHEILFSLINYMFIQKNLSL
jgi:hypothetical protein